MYSKGIKSFLSGSGSKESTCKAGDTGSLWVGKTNWRRAWLATAVFLPGESQERRILAGYSPGGCESWTQLKQLSMPKGIGNKTFITWVEYREENGQLCALPFGEQIKVQDQFSIFCIAWCLTYVVFLLYLLISVYQYVYVFKYTCNHNGLPSWLKRERIHLQCKRPGFDPWVGKMPWRRAWQPTPVFLPGGFDGQRSLEGYSPWGPKESDMPEQLSIGHNHNIPC